MEDDELLGIRRAKSVTGSILVPTMHPDYAIGTRVRVDLFGTDEWSIAGTITGVASVHILFHYIVTLIEPLTLEGYPGWTTLSVSGCQIKLWKPEESGTE